MSVAVTLHIYDLVDQAPLVCGFFHTGVVVNGIEWCFGAGGGICGQSPLQNVPDGARFREALLIDYIRSASEVGRAIELLRPEFPEEAYSVVFRNCNDFSNRLCQVLCNKSIPGYINRLAWLGRQIPFRFCIPKHLWPEVTPRTALLTVELGVGHRLDVERQQPRPLWKRVLFAPFKWINRLLGSRHVDDDELRPAIDPRFLRFSAAENRMRPANSV